MFFFRNFSYEFVISGIIIYKKATKKKKTTTKKNNSGLKKLLNSIYLWPHD